ncbi:hypothetical protein POM88_013146 [Heracleum sosnowskyi]|uniref:Uncharacterized protein n=1 Tax=Heracleum sosnowskyi TaxID=360622 RepID=A0AAD8J1L2_9APIA|nr:hypothetical protein POM88_013146 [Heracleum sosnowskyi]
MNNDREACYDQTSQFIKGILPQDNTFLIAFPVRRSTRKIWDFLMSKLIIVLMDPMSEAKSLQPASPDNKGIGEKAVGFAQFTSPKKHNGGASVDINGFAKIVSKKKHSQSANVGLAPNSQVPDQRMSKAISLQVASPDDEGIGDKAARVAQLASLKKRSRGASVGIDGILDQKKDSQTTNVGKQGNFAPNSKVTKPAIEKAGDTDQHTSKSRYLQAASPDDEGIGDKATGLAQLASLKKRSGGASFGIDGIVNQKKDNRSANIGKLDRFAPNSKVTKPTIEKAGCTDQVRMRRLRSHVENVPALSEQGVPAHSGQHVQDKSGQHIRAHSEQGTGQRVHVHTGQSFAARSPSRPDLQIHVPSQSILHSPTQSGQRTSLSAQSTPNESLQQSAQSRQHTPESQSHLSTLNVSSTAANDNVCWNMGSTQRDGRIRKKFLISFAETLTAYDSDLYSMILSVF